MLLHNGRELSYTRLRMVIRELYYMLRTASIRQMNSENNYPAHKLEFRDYFYSKPFFFYLETDNNPLTYIYQT